VPGSLSRELLTLIDTCNEFVANVMNPAAEHPTDAARALIRAGAKDVGLFPMTQPTDFGGSASSALALCVARETLCSHNPSYLDAVFGPSPGVLANVKDPLYSSHLRPLLAGTIRGSFGFTEPDDAAHPTAGIIQGNELIINGQKSYVTGGADADFINTLVDIKGRGSSLVVINTATAGVALERRFTALDGSHHAAFKFTDVTVPTAHIIGEPGQGLPKAMRQIGDTRLLFAAQASGYMLWTINLLNTHLLGIDKSGKPRGSQNVVRLRYADLRIKAFAARSMLYRTARLADQGQNIVNEAMACKVFATEAVGEIVDTAIQLVGGGALVEDHPLAKLYQKVRTWRLAEGASDVLRLNIGRGILELGKGRI